MRSIRASSAAGTSGFSRAAGTCASAEIRERPPLDEFHAQIGPAAARAGVVNGADVRVIQGGGGAGLTAESFQPDGVAGAVFRKELERDRPVEAQLPRLVDDSHAAMA